MNIISWRLKTREVETEHDEYVPVGDVVEIQVGKNRYHVTSVWVVDDRVIWIEARRYADGGVPVNITVTPEEIIPISDYVGDCDLIDQYLSTRSHPKAG